jgi:acyl dehydratase
MLGDNQIVSPLGISLEELRGKAGQEIAITDWLPITQQRIQQFADATGDHQWIHVDDERAAAESPYGGTIAHGFLTLSLLSQFMRQALEIKGLRMAINYGLNRVRFPAAVRVGSRVRARFALLSTKDVEAGVEVVYQATLQADGVEKPCCVAEWILRYYLP